jgi:ubiquinone/menaquinone biosynthesis C-methylase UbiE
MFLLNYSNLVDPLLSDIRDFVLDFAGMTAEDRVLDICCGTGAQVIRYGMNGIEAVGIDSDPNMLKAASKNKSKTQLTNISFHLADATDLPFSEGYFTYSSIMFGLHDKEKPIRDRVIGEMKRVVKNKGRFIFVDFEVPLPMNKWGIFARTIEFFVGGDHYRGFKSYIKGGGLPVILKEHNLRNIQKMLFAGGLIGVTKAINDN